jgi:hypothetical protein
MLVVTVDGLAASGVGVFATPAPYGVAAAELAGMFFIQSAFQAGPLAVAMPIVNWVQPLIAVALGVSVLAEPMPTDARHLGALAVGALAALAGILVLDRSPRVRAMHASPRDVRPEIASKAQARFTLAA